MTKKTEVEHVRFRGKDAYEKGLKETLARGFEVTDLQTKRVNPDGCLWGLFNFFVGPITGHWYPPFMKQKVWDVTFVKGV